MCRVTFVRVVDDEFAVGQKYKRFPHWILSPVWVGGATLGYVTDKIPSGPMIETLIHVKPGFGEVFWDRVPEAQDCSSRHGCEGFRKFVEEGLETHSPAIL
jgi:hypothetical protein